MASQIFFYRSFLDLLTMTVAVHDVQRLGMLTAKSMKQSRALKASQKHSLHFMEPGGSLLCSQKPATCPCPEPNKPIPSYFF
jgi:hypothetical protein